METLVEIMGTQQMQDLRLSSYSQSLLDRSHIQPTALSMIGKAKQHKTFSPRAWSPGNSGQAFFNLWTCPLWCTIDMWNPLQNGEEYLGERCQNRIENASIPRLFLELGSYGSIETLAFSTDRPQVFKLLYKPSKMNRIPGLLVVLRALPWA